MPPPSRNYPNALALLAWCKGQERYVAPDYVERVYAAAIAACLNAKDETITRLVAKLDALENDQGFPRDTHGQG